MTRDMELIRKILFAIEERLVEMERNLPQLNRNDSRRNSWN